MRESAQTEAALRTFSVQSNAVLRLKCWSKAQASGRAVTLLGQEFPSRIGGTLTGSVRALCVGPSEWLVVSHERTASELIGLLQPQLTAYDLALVDISDAITITALTGPRSRDILSMGCGLDLNPRSFPVGSCAPTRFAQIAVVIEHDTAPDGFRLYVARSYAHYLSSWLADAAGVVREWPGAKRA